jgi:hypothetical protein
MVSLGINLAFVYLSNQGFEHSQLPHLGIIGLHPLHSPPFVKVCFITKHILGLMGPCTSHLVANPMLRLWHLCSICSHPKILGRWMRGYEHLCGMECLQKLFKPNECQATNYQKPPRTYMVNIINLFNFFNSYTKNVIIYILNVF